MDEALTLGQVAARFGLQTWQVQYVANQGKLPEHPKIGAYRVVYQSELPKVLEALIDAGYLLRGDKKA